MRATSFLFPAGRFGSVLLLAGCLATPPQQPPVVSASERRANYQGALTAVVVLAPASEAQAQRSTADEALSNQVDAAMRRRLREAGVPALAAGPDSTAAQWRRQGASHSVRISLPAAADGRTAVHVELRDTLTRSVVWRYAGELDTASRPPPQQVADRMADAVVHRLREDGLLAR